jgi:DNA-nicking Smr family endonuclease
MKRPGRPLSPAEAELWKRVAATVTPIRGTRNPSLWGQVAERGSDGGEAATAQPLPRGVPSTTRFAGAHPPPVGEDLKRARPLSNHTLDGTWDRKLSNGVVQPDFTLDLHGHTLDSAHARLDHGLTQALAQGARVLLLITGKPRPSDEHDARGSRRGAIRAKVLDWLAAGSHASRIAAIRPAHPRHGGAGALYIVLKRPK